MGVQNFNFAPTVAKNGKLPAPNFVLLEENFRTGNFWGNAPLAYHEVTAYQHIHPKYQQQRKDVEIV